MHVAPEASLNDSLLDVVVIGDIGKFDLLKSIPMIYKGTHGKHPKVSIEKAARVTVESSERILVQADGELLGEGPATFSLMPAALNISLGAIFSLYFRPDRRRYSLPYLRLALRKQAA